MENYKKLMSKVDAVIAQQDKKTPVAASGLLSPSRLASVKPLKEDSPEASIAKYVAMIRKQRKELVK